MAHAPIDSDCCDRQETDADVSISQKGHEDTKESYVRPAGVDEPDGIKRQHQQTEHEICDAQAIPVAKISF